MLTRTNLAAHLMITLLATLAYAADTKAPAPEPDADFAYQGEYTGEIQTAANDKGPWGIQVVALGDGKFRAIAYKGGLPGAGWVKEEGRIESEGTIKDGTVTFPDPNGGSPRAVLDKTGVIVLSDPNDANVNGRIAKTARKSPTLGAKPPEGAIVLFDGKEINDFTKKANELGLLPQGSNSKRTFGSHTLHIEFILPYEPKGRGQARGNSGVYLQGRYEVQVLDSFGLEGKNNECGGIYSIAAPSINMCFPPLTWQTYDIDFTAARFDAAGKKTKNARMTVKHNGVVIHDDVELPNPTTAAPNKETPEPGILHLQDHGHRVHYRNIWVVEKK